MHSIDISKSDSESICLSLQHKTGATNETLTIET